MHTSLPYAALDTARARLSAHIESDDATALEWWITHPRIQLASAISDLGQSLMRLGNRIDDAAPNGDESEAFRAGYRTGYRAGARQAGSPPDGYLYAEHVALMAGTSAVDVRQAMAAGCLAHREEDDDSGRRLIAWDDAVAWVKASAP
ncbi:5'-nucleotidase [Humibacillus xanthopallidus]|uniref:Uncharacterized protein n=1 Tax=Humibacillus xanthopallidus TaxID=412689 RepID=A0A543HX73_9MICO|nr:5'-nucleotidase [Humibacillus xanthopallidus]TQM62937.1 hypothetical protein FBY41_2982 [Humibacillus xanthopallidus]